MAFLKANGPFLGVNKSVDPGYLGPTEAQDALNVYLTYGTLWKRPGLTSVIQFTDNPPILGIYDYLKVDTVAGGTTPIGMVKTGPTTEGANATLYRIDLGTGGTPEATDLGVSMHPTNLCSFLTANNRVYFCDGTVFNVWDGGDQTYNAAVSRPTTNIMAEDSGNGPLTGSYDYKYTWYSSTWGIESPSSEASLDYPGTYRQPTEVYEACITVSISGSDKPDNRFDKIRLYRRHASANETVWTYLTEITSSGTLSYTDSTPDANVLSSLQIAPVTFDSTLPAFQFMAAQEDVTFASGADTAPTALYYSLTGQPWTLYQYLEVGSGIDTDAVTGLVPFGGVLVVFKERSIWILSGNSIDTFDLKKVVPGVGCRGHGSIVEAGSLLYFLSEDGFYCFDGSSAIPLSGAATQDPIRSDIRSRNYARDKCCVGGWDADNGAVLWSYSSAGAAQNDSMYAFFPEHSKSVQYPSFCPQNMGGVSAMGILSDQTTRDRVFHIGRTDGVLGYLDGETDNGEAIQFRWRTGDFDAGEPWRFKIWKEFQTEVEPQVNGDTLAVSYYLNGSDTAAALGTHDTTAATSRARISQSSRSISMQFSMSSDGPLELKGWILEHETCGNV